MHGHLEMVKYLFEKGAPINTDAIMMASYNGNLEMVKYLFEKGAPIDTDAIQYASIYDRIEVVKYLVGVNAPRSAEDSEKIEKIVQECREYRQELLTSLEYRLGHPSYIVLDYLEYSL